MTIQTAAQMADHIKNLKAQRKAGELGAKAYYTALLQVLNNLADSLIAELDGIEDADVRSQIPLLIVLLDDQIRTLGERGA